MLERLSITDFAVARSVVVEPGPGLNVFTGETGAGKSLIVDALAFVFGARRGREVIATGAAKAEVEAILSPGGQAISRNVGLSGRSTARLNGELVQLPELLALAANSIDIHGQSEQLAILRPQEQLAVLDAYAGLREHRANVTGIVRALRETRRQLRNLQTGQRERQRLIEQLTFEAHEIADANLAPGEDDELRQEQQRLSNVRRLQSDAAEAITALEAFDAGAVVRAVADVASRDGSASELADTAALLETAAADLTRMLRRYGEALEDDPERLAEIEERLDLIARLRRKYGETVVEILDYGRGAQLRLEELTGAGASAEELHAREAAQLAELASCGLSLSRARRGAAAALVRAVSAELGRLGMGGASLAIGFACEDAEDGPLAPLPDFEIIDGAPGEAPAHEELVTRGFTEDGLDRVEFLASFNPGEAPRGLGSVASGGETSRFLLAVTTVLGNASEPRTIVLDEVDEGVGGRAGALVGEALQRLAQRHQVLCVTHLPQVAACGESHFVVSKHTDGARSWSEIRAVTGEERVDELASMLGAITPATRETARELLRLRA